MKDLSLGSPLENPLESLCLKQNIEVGSAKRISRFIASLRHIPSHDDLSHDHVLSRIRLLIALRLGIEIDSDDLKQILNHQGVSLRCNPSDPSDPIVGFHSSVFEFERELVGKFLSRFF